MTRRPSTGSGLSGLPWTPFRVFVTGTDTGVGKTQVSTALLSLLADAGRLPAPMKPYETGVTRARGPEDALAMRAAARSEDALDDICVHRFRLPLAPGVAAVRERRPADFSTVQAAYERFAGRDLVVEGAGGLFVPLDAERDVIDVIVAWNLPVVLVARAGLGTLNHVALSLEALAQRRARVLAVVLSRGTPAADPSLKDNAPWLARRHRVLVLGPVPYLEDARRRREAFRRALAPLLDPALKGGTRPPPATGRSLS